jgi:mono/diheme cytochrome c family protein
VVTRIRTRLPLILVLVVLGAGVLVYVAAAGRPFAADRAPGPVETAIARQLVRLSIPRSERNAANPFAGDPAAWRGAADHFAEHCAVCHGADGRGSPIGSHMYPPVPDLASPAIQQFSDGALFSIIQNGVRWTGMPAFRSTDDPAEMWRLVSFVRHVPAVNAADFAHHDGEVEGGAAAATVAMDGTAFVPAEAIRSRTTFRLMLPRSIPATSIRTGRGGSARAHAAPFSTSARCIPEWPACFT